MSQQIFQQYIRISLFKFKIHIKNTNMEVEQQFQILLQKLMSYQVDKVCWSDNMDLVALVTFDNIIELTRISYRAQKVFQVEEKQPITSITFSPDSFLLVYGCVDGSIKIIKTENSEKVLVNEKYHQGSIENINWVYYHKLRPEKIMPFKKDSIENKLILAISPHVNCDKNSIVKLKYLGEISDEFTFLLSSERNKTYLNLNGFIPIVNLNYSELKLTDFNVIYSTYSDKISTLIGNNRMDEIELILVTYDCTELNSLKDDLIRINYLVAYIGELLAFTQNSYQAITNQIKDILRQYSNKINLIEDPNNTEITVNPAQDLLKFLNLGIGSPAVNNFLTKQLHDTKFLQKLDESLTLLFTNIQDLELESTQNVLERLILLLKKLMNMCSIKKYDIFGLKIEILKEFEDEICELYNLGEILLMQSTESKFDIRNFLVWLNKITIKTSQESETETENMKSYLNKYTVDVNRLREFLKDQTRFRLKNLHYIVSGKWELIKFGESFQIIEKQKQQNPQKMEFNDTIKKQNYNNIEKELGLSGIVLQTPQKMNIETQKRNAMEILKSVEIIWKKIAKIPSERMNELVIKKFSSTKIGTIKLNNQISNPIIRVYDKRGEFNVYYVEIGMTHKLIRFNCNTKEKTVLKAPPGYSIIDVSISKEIVLVLLERQKFMFLGSLSQESYQIGNMIFTKQMNIQANECSINSSDHGLSSLLIDKNKLMIV